MDAASQKRLAKVHPELARRVEKVIADLTLGGRDVRVVQGLRTYAQQDALFAKGRSRPGEIVTNARGGQSNHNFGLAVDLCPFRNGRPNWNDMRAFFAIGVAAEKHGLEWGGRWTKFVDKPHVELPTKLTVSQCHKLYTRGGLAAVWRRADELISATANDSDSAEPNKPEPAPTPAEPADRLPKTLKRGDTGNAVRALQLKLKKLGYALKVDGDYGPNTERVVKGFQLKQGLKVDGIAGPDTQRLLGL